MRAKALFGIVSLFLAGCSGGGAAVTTSGTASLPSLAPTSPSPTTPSISPSPTLSSEDAAAVEATVRSYFEAFGLADSLASVHERSNQSAGPLKSWADWVAEEGPSQGGSTSDITITTLRAAGLQNDIALVDLDVLVHSDQPPDLHMTGPAKVQRTPDGWKLIDYIRNGRDQQASIFSSPRGAAEKPGLSVRVLGVVLQTDYIDVFMLLTNRGSSAIDLFQDASLVLPSGKQFGGGQYYSNYRVAPHAHLVTDFVWASESLPLSTKGFRLTFSAGGGSNNYDFDIPVKLR